MLYLYQDLMVKKLDYKLNIKMLMERKEKLKHGALNKIIFLFSSMTNILKNGLILLISWVTEIKTNAFIDIEDFHS